MNKDNTDDEMLLYIEINSVSEGKCKGTLYPETHLETKLKSLSPGIIHFGYVIHESYFFHLHGKKLIEKYYFLNI